MTPRNELGFGPSTDAVSFSTESGKFHKPYNHIQDIHLFIQDIFNDVIQTATLFPMFVADPRVSEHVTGEPPGSIKAFDDVLRFKLRLHNGFPHRQNRHLDPVPVQIRRLL